MNTQELETKVSVLPAQANDLKVEDEESYSFAGAMLVNIKGLRREIDETFGPIITKAHAAHKEAVAQRKRHEAPLIEAEGTIKNRMAVYHAELERLRQIEEARLQEEADLAEATEAEAEGDTERAEAVLNGGGTTAVSLAPTAKPEGVSFRENWRCEVTNLRQLVEAYLDGKVPEDVICADMKVLNASARALKGSLNWPGVKAVKTTSVAAGRR